MSDVLTMIQAYESGETLEALAQRFESSVTTVWQTLTKNGCKMRSPGGHTRTRLRSKHPGWKGGRRINTDGYVLMRVYPGEPYDDMVNVQGYVPEHRLVMAKALGRSLSRRETVHHLNGDRSDNRLVNLQLRQGQHGAGQVFRCSDCGSTHVEAVEL